MAKQKNWTQDEIDFLIKNYRKMFDKDIAKALNRSFLSVEGKVTRLKKKGLLPKIKLTKDEVVRLLMEANTYEVGTISIRRCNTLKRSYKWIKLAPNKFKKLHIYNWEKAHGKLPENYGLRFKDGNSLNCDLSNLICVHRSKVLKENANTPLRQKNKKISQLGGFYEAILKGYVPK